MKLAVKVAACLGAQMCTLCACSLLGGFFGTDYNDSWLYYTTTAIICACVAFMRVMFFRTGVRWLLGLALLILTAALGALFWLFSVIEVQAPSDETWSFAVFEDADAAHMRQRERGLKALCLVWGLLMLSFTGAVFTLVMDAPPQHDTNNTAGERAIKFAFHNAALVTMLGASGVAVFNDREWDWRYAFAVFLAICISSYIAGSLSWCWITLCKQQDCWQRVVGGLFLLPVFVIEDCYCTLLLSGGDSNY